MNYWDQPIEVTPMQADGQLAGFLLVGRWPKDTVEWTRFLLLAVRVAAAPGMLPRGSTVFRVVEDVPAVAPLHTIGLVLAEGPLVGDRAVSPGAFAHLPPALAVLHPPSSTTSSVREYTTASGCLFLPGLPHLGLGHRAAWIEADAAGTITHLASSEAVDPMSDADTAVLSTLLAA
ncbi:MAG: peptidase [Propionicimonas sp.]|uniref:peptidase n=1 Tax=Propionicimonas sp. TaxID=1955623 RepID=UPI003D0A302E